MNANGGRVIGYELKVIGGRGEEVIGQRSIVIGEENEEAAFHRQGPLSQRFV
jgi:hypothetical protein